MERRERDEIEQMIAMIHASVFDTQKLLPRLEAEFVKMMQEKARDGNTD